MYGFMEQEAEFRPTFDSRTHKKRENVVHERLK